MSARAERAAHAGEDRDVCGVIGVNGAKGVGQGVRGGAIHGVAALRVVELDDCDVYVALDVGNHGETASLHDFTGLLESDDPASVQRVLAAKAAGEEVLLCFKGASQ